MIPVTKQLPPAGRSVLGSCRVGRDADPEVLIVEYHNDGYWRNVATGESVAVSSWESLPQHSDALKADKKYCRGCRNNFYNGNNPIGVKECWSFDTAKVVTRFRLSVNTPCNQRDGYERMETHDCRQDDGYVFVEKIPSHAR